MNSLKLGDLTLDPRRVVYLSSIQALVCSGLQGLATNLNKQNTDNVFQGLNEAIHKYKPEALINLGYVNGYVKNLSLIRKHWPSKLKLQMVTNHITPEMQKEADSAGFEIYRELLWSNYRFVEISESENLDFPLFTITSSPHYVIRLGKGLFGGLDLEVFLKSSQSLLLPSLKSDHKRFSILNDSLSRYDVFAIGYHRVFPMGKVEEIQIYREKLGAVPITKTALQGKLTSRKSQIDLQH